MTFNRITPGDIGANYLLILGAKITIVAIMILIVRSKRSTLIKTRAVKKESTRTPKLNRIINSLTGYNLLIILGAAVFLLSDILHMIYTSTLQN